MNEYFIKYNTDPLPLRGEPHLRSPDLHFSGEAPDPTEGEGAIEDFVAHVKAHNEFQFRRNPDQQYTCSGNVERVNPSLQNWEFRNTRISVTPECPKYSDDVIDAMQVVQQMVLDKLDRDIRDHANGVIPVKATPVYPRGCRVRGRNYGKTLELEGGVDQ